MNNLKVEAQFGGGNITIRGTIRVKGTTHAVQCSGSVGDGGTNAIVDGQEYWWCGSDQNFENPLVEREIERVLKEVYNVAFRNRIDVESNWMAIIKTGVYITQCCGENEMVSG